MPWVRADAATVGARLRLARRRAGYTQALVAAETGCSPSLISKLERGAAELRDIDRARRLAELLRVSPVWLLGLDQPPEAERGRERPAPGTPSGYDTRSVNLPDEGIDPMDRRRALKAGAALVGGAVTASLEIFDPGDRDRLLAALTAPERNLSERVITVLEATDARYQRRRNPLPVGVRVRMARQRLAMAQRLRTGARTRDHSERLAIVEAQSARQSARLAANWLQDPQTARATFEVGLAAAHDAGEHSVTLRGYLLGGLAFLDSRFGQPLRGVATVDAALEVAEGSPVQGLRCWLASTAATVYAAVGDRHACDRALGTAEDLFVVPGPDDPPWLDFLSRRFLLEDRVACQLRIGRPAAALDTLTQAETLAEPHRLERHALLLAYRAEALVRAGQPGEGAETARQALDVGMTVGYQRAVDQVRTLRAVRLHRQRTLPVVRELDELLRESTHLIV